MIDSNIKLQQILEGAILAAGDALSIDRLSSLFEEQERPEKAELLDALAAIRENYHGRGFSLVEVSSGWRFQVQPELAQWVNRLWDEKPQKYSRAILETIALIAYRQPLTRSDIEEVRGVAVSSHIIKTLAEREWIKVVGHRDVPGRPSLYATTRQFLDYFGLKSLDELPILGEIKDIDSLNARLELEDDEVSLEKEQIAEAQEITTSEEGVDDIAPDEDNPVTEHLSEAKDDLGGTELSAQQELLEDVDPVNDAPLPGEESEAMQEKQDEL